MVLTEKESLKFLLFVCLSLIKVSGFVVFNEEEILDSLDSFGENARAKEALDGGREKLKSGEQVGRLVVRQNQTPNSLGDASKRFSSHLGRSDGNAYQSDDTGRMKLRHLWGQVYALDTPSTPTVDRLLQLKPRLDCVGDLMKLTVHGRDAPFGSNFLIDRGNNPPLPLSQLPSVCGQRFLRTWRDFVFIIPHDGCYVSQERDTFVLSLLWWGLSVELSCSSLTSKPRAPTVSCYGNGMIVKLYRVVSEDMKIKVMNEWQPLLEGSARCGYSLESHAEGLVVHVPYFPCTEPKDGVFTLSIAAENAFNLSCPALSLNRPSLPDHAPMNRTPMLRALVSETLPPTITTTTAQPESSTTSTNSKVQKLHTTSLPYYIPNQRHFKQIPPSYPFLRRPPKVPPMVEPRGRKIVDPLTAVTQQPRAPVYIKPPQTWYPWNPKPNFGLTPVPSQSTALPYPGEPLLLPTKTPKTPFAPLLKPTSMPVVPPLQWMPRFPPRNLVYPLNSGNLGFVAPSSNEFPQDPYWVFQNQPGPSQAPPKPESAPPTPAPTREAEPQLFHSWYKPYPPHYSVMPPVPPNVPQSNTFSDTYQSFRFPPMSLESDFPPIAYPTPSLPKSPETDTPVPMYACMTAICLPHAQSHVLPFWLSGAPSISFHHHNHQYFGHQPLLSFKASTRTKIKGRMLSSPVTSEESTQFPLEGMGNNYGQSSSEDAVVPPASESTAVQYLEENPIKGPSNVRKLETNPSASFTMKTANVAPVTRTLVPSERTSRPLQNGPVSGPLVYSNQNPKSAVYQAEKNRYVPPGVRNTQAGLAPPNVPFFEQIVQNVSVKPTMRPARSKHEYMNRWYKVASNAMPLISDHPTKGTFRQPSNRNSFEPSTMPPQPERRSGNFPVMHSRQHNLRSGESVFPVLSSTYWVPAVQSNQDALLSSYRTNGYEASHPH